MQLHVEHHVRGHAGRALTTGVAGLAGVLLALTTSGPELAMNGPSATAIAGTGAGLLGIALLVIAYRAATTGRPHRIHLVGAAVGILLVQFVVVPAFNVGVIIHAPTPAVPPATTLGYPGARDVTFTTPDGVRLAAWYVPGHTGAGVILMHGSHSDRTSELPYLRFLAEAGYTVLAVDARGHGESGGETNALGWYGDRDVAGAFRFLSHQSGIDPHRIAGLGLSMGAEELLRAAAGGVPLAAVVADGAGASTSTDSDITPRGVDAPLYDAVTWLTYRGVQLLSGEAEPPGLISVVTRIDGEALLITSDARDEHLLGQRFAGAIGPRAEVWFVRDAGHTRAYATHPALYRDRVVAFLRAVLGPAS